MADKKVVYMVTSGYYSDYGVNGIFTTREKAEEFIKMFPGEDSIVGEMELDVLDSALEFMKVGRRPYYVEMKRDGDSTVRAQFAQVHDCTQIIFGLLMRLMLLRL